MNISLSRRFVTALLAFSAGALLTAPAAKAQPISILNSDFSTGTGTLSGTILSPSYTNAAIGTATPWLATGTAVGSILGVDVLSPTVNINGDLTISSLTSVSTLVRNAATVFNNNILTNFVSGQTYVLTVDFTSNVGLSLSVLNNIGAGISLRAAGVDVANSISNPSFITASAFAGTSGSISMTYTAGAGQNGSNIGVSLFTGQGTGLATVGLLSDISFDNLTLTAIPEPSTWAAWFGGACLLTALMKRRRAQAAIAGGR